MYSKIICNPIVGAVRPRLLFVSASMPRIVLQAVVRFVVATAALAQTHVTPGRVGTVMVGKASDGFALATDSASPNPDGTLCNAQKLLPAGKNAGLLCARPRSIQVPVRH